MHHTSTIPCKLFSQMSRVHWEKFHHKFENNFLRILKHNISISFISTVTGLQKHTHICTPTRTCTHSPLPSPPLLITPSHGLFTEISNFHICEMLLFWTVPLCGQQSGKSSWPSSYPLSLSLEFLFLKMCPIWGLLCPLLRSVEFRKIYHLLLGILHSRLREGPYYRGRWISAGSKIRKGN